MLNKVIITTAVKVVITAVTFYKFSDYLSKKAINSEKKA